MPPAAPAAWNRTPEKTAFGRFFNFRKQSKKQELLVHFMIDVFWFFASEKRQKTLKMTRQQCSDTRHGWFCGAFLKKKAVFQY